MKHQSEFPRLHSDWGEQTLNATESVPEFFKCNISFTTINGQTETKETLTNELLIFIFGLKYTTRSLQNT